MNRYKQELELRGYTNLPTIKNVYTKTGKHIKFIDNCDIKTVKQALNIDNQPVFKRWGEITVTVPGYPHLNRVYRGIITNYQSLFAFVKKLKRKHNINGTVIEITRTGTMYT